MDIDRASTFTTYTLKLLSLLEGGLNKGCQPFLLLVTVHFIVHLVIDCTSSES